MTWAAASHNQKYWYISHLTPKWHSQWKSWPSDNNQCQYSIPKAHTHSYTLWEDNISLGHGLLSYFLLSTLITTYNLVFATSLPSRASCVTIFFFIMIMNHTKWTYGIECQPLIDLMEMFWNPGNQIGPPWDWLQPHTTKNIGILAIVSIQLDKGLNGYTPNSCQHLFNFQYTPTQLIFTKLQFQLEKAPPLKYPGASLGRLLYNL